MPINYSLSDIYIMLGKKGYTDLSGSGKLSKRVISGQELANLIVASGDTNIANTDLTFTANRSHTGGAFDISFTGTGDFSIGQDLILPSLTYGANNLMVLGSDNSLDTVAMSTINLSEFNNDLGGGADNLGNHTATEIIKSETFGVQFNGTGQTIIGDNGGLTFDIPLGDIYVYNIDSSEVMSITAQGPAIPIGGQYSFGVAGQNISSSSSGITAAVPTGDFFRVTVNAADAGRIDASGIRINNSNGAGVIRNNTPSITSEVFGFWGDTGTGLGHSTSDDNIFSLISNGAVVGTVTPTNFSLGDASANDATVFGGTTLLQGGFRLPDVTQAPAGTLSAGGGLMWVSGTSLNFMDDGGTITDLTSGGGSIGGSTGATDNALLRADGVGGATVQNSTATLSDNGDLTIYDATNDGNPVFAYGASATDRLTITPTYDSGAQTLDYVEFATDSGNVAADKGLFRFSVDGTTRVDIDDSGIVMPFSGSRIGQDGNNYIDFSDNSVTIAAGSGDAIYGQINGQISMAVRPSFNIEFGNFVNSFGSTTAGTRCVRINDVGTVPAGTLTSGGLLYVSGTSLFFHDDAGTATDLTAGGGDVTKVGTPVDSQIGVWTGDGTIEGDANFTFDTVSDLLTIGGNIGDATVRISKSNSNVGALEFYDEGAAEADIRLTNAESLEIRVGNVGTTAFSIGTSSALFGSTEFGSNNTGGARLQRTGTTMTDPMIYRGTDTNTGIGADMTDGLSMISNGKASIASTDAGAGVNLEFLGNSGLFGATTSGQGVLRINEVTTVPEGTMTDGALIYVTGEDIRTLSEAGNDVSLTEETFIFDVSRDETTALSTGTSDYVFRMPYAATLVGVRASVTTAPTTQAILIDINETGSTIFSTRLSIDADEKTSTTAAAPAVISDSALADDAEITIDIDQVGSGTTGAGLKVYMTFRRES